MKTIKYLLGLLLLATLSACYEDKGNYDYHEIDEVAVKGIPESVEIDRFSKLEINPDISGSIFGNDTSKYTYEWKIADKVISTRKDLDYEVGVAQGSYTLLFTITEKDTKVKTFVTTKLIVNYSTSSDGILVVSSKDGKADLSYLRLDIPNAKFMTMFYNKNHDESLGTHPRQLHQTFVDGAFAYVRRYGGYGIKLICDEGLVQLSNVTLDYMGKIDKNFFLSYGELYPVPDYSSYTPEYMNNIVFQWRRTPYGSIMNDEYLYVIAGGGIYVISYERAKKPEVFYSNYVGGEGQKCKFSPMMFVTGRKPTPNKGKNLNAGWTTTDMECVFDENQGVFYTFSSGELTAVDPDVSFPGYKAFYGEDTYQMGFCFAAMEKEGKVRFATFNTESQNHIASVDAMEASPSSRFFMLRNSPYVYFNTTKGIYKYNILNVASGIAPNTSDRIISLEELGYSKEAVISDICLHRNEKKMVIAVSRYGDDTQGKGDELKGDIVEVSLEGAKPKVLNKYTGVCGVKPLVIYKYRTFGRNDEYLVD